MLTKIVTKIQTLDTRYEETLDTVRFWKREAYLAKTASPYVKRSELPKILRYIDQSNQEGNALFAEMEELRERYGLSWEDWIEIAATKREVRA